MDYDEAKVDEMVLALLYLKTEDRGRAIRAWKDFPRDSLDRLCEQDYIGDPRTGAKSVVMTEEGLQRSEELFKRHFGA